MLTTVKGEVDVSGSVRLLEPVEVTKTTPAILTLLDDQNDDSSEDDVNRLREFLRGPKFTERGSYSAEEIEAKIEEARASWK